MSGKIIFNRECGQPTSEGHIELTDVVLDDAFRCREQEDDDTVESYAEAFTKYIKANKRADKLRYEQLHTVENLDYPFPPAWVWQEDEQVYLITGFHRYKAATKAGQEKLKVKEFHGTKEEAIVFAMKDNRKNGRRLNDDDLKYCIAKALLIFPEKTAGAIAKEMGCGRSHAYRIQKELSRKGQLPEVEKRRGADNKERSVKRKVKQPPKTATKQSGNDPISDDQSKKKTNSAPVAIKEPASVPVPDRQCDENGMLPDQNNTIPQDVPEVVTPVEAAENIQPLTPGLVGDMDSLESYCRELIREHRQREDRVYIAHRIKEFAKCVEKQYGKLCSQG
jgi:hypothetical protein